METSKYYTPSIEEFHVGFEFEWRHKPTPVIEFNPDLISSLDFINYGAPAAIEIRKQHYSEYIKIKSERETWKQRISDEKFFDTDRDDSEYPNIYDAFDENSVIEFRVPYLSKEDIEAAGWDYDNNMGNGPDEIGFLLQPWYELFRPHPDPFIQYILLHNTKTQFSTIERIVDCGSDIEDMLFRGIIKNKSELRRILKMVII